MKWYFAKQIVSFRFAKYSVITFLSLVKIIEKYGLHLINLWLPSMCQSARGPETRYTWQRIDSLHLWWTPKGSALSSDCRIFSHCIRKPLPLTWLISILSPIPGWPLCASLTRSSSSSSLMLLYVPTQLHAFCVLKKTNYMINNLSHPNKMFRFPSPSLSWRWVGRSGKI